MLFPQYAQRFHKSSTWRFAARSLDALDIFSSRKPNSAEPKRIVIIRKDEIGDVILSIPLYEALKKRFPQSKISVIIGATAAQLLRNNPYIDKIIEFNTSKSPISNFRNLIHILKSGKFDLGIDPKGSIVNIMAMWQAKIARRISYYNVSGGKPFLTDAIEYSDQVSEIDATFNLVKHLGVKKIAIPKIYLTEKEENQADKFIKENLPKKYICIYATPSKRYKEWPLQRWRQLCEAFPEERFVFVGSRHDRFSLSPILGKIRNAFFVEIDLRTLSRIFQKAKAIVAVDGGPMHLAWISNPKTIALFGQNDITLWKPQRGITLTHFPKDKQGINRELPELNKPNQYMDMISLEEVSHMLKGYV
jgi:ADP-heptose:LPS heptosyltransferase